MSVIKAKKVKYTVELIVYPDINIDRDVGGEIEDYLEFSDDFSISEQTLCANVSCMAIKDVEYNKDTGEIIEETKRVF